MQSQYGSMQGIDWQNVVFGGTAKMTNHNININGSNKKTKQNVIDLAKHNGDYKNINIYRSYLPVAATEFENPLVVVNYTGYNNELTKNKITDIKSQGYKVFNIFGNDDISNSKSLNADELWIESLFRDLEKNKVELLPLNQNMIDVNTGLAGQQHLLY